MQLRLPASLHYPITVTELLVKPDENVERGAPLFSYFYKSTVTESDDFGEKREVEKTFPTRFESPLDGLITRWNIKAGTVLTQDVAVAEVEEPCSHSVQFGGMCTMCGKDMTSITYTTEMSDAQRATIPMIHDNNALVVSPHEANRLEQEARSRLLKSRKLSLVVDLDQTIIHATVDPTVLEWQNDPENPNYEAVKDVRVFQLMEDGPGARGCSYYIKLRPGLAEFLRNVSKLFELHIYTMGTRAYAQQIANIVDPDRSIFGDRILSRDESGSLTVKNLQRLFPMDTKMVVIIDDRGDVWKWNDNLIKVSPYDFFVGIGDINSSFLPKQPDLRTDVKPPKNEVPDPNKDLAEGATTKEPEPAVEEDADETKNNNAAVDESQESQSTSEVSTLEQLVSMSGGDDPSLLQQQTDKQDEALIAQLQDRPLLQKQKLLDAKDLAASEDGENPLSEEKSSQTSEESSSISDSSTESGKPRHNLLHDDDRELIYLEQSLIDVHRAFYEDYESGLSQVQGGRLAELRGEKPPKKSMLTNGLTEQTRIPDVKDLLTTLKLRVLDGVKIVFSGVVPLSTDVRSSDIAIWAMSFGAQIHEHLTHRTTHLVAARDRTAKVRQAARHPRIKIINTQWLLDSISQWQRLDEEPYLIPIHPDDRHHLSPSNGPSSDKDELHEENGTDDDNKFTLSSSDEEGSNMSDEESEAPSERPEPAVDPFDNYDQEAVDEELKEFLGSDAEDSDSESVASDTSRRSQSRKKRKRSATPSSETSGGSSSEERQADQEETEAELGSRLAKRQQIARGRQTRLHAVANANPSESSSQAENGTGQRSEAGTENGDDSSRDEEADELEKDLAAELERELSNDRLKD